MEQRKSNNNFQVFASLMGMTISKESYSALSYLMDSMQQMAKSQLKYGESGRKMAIQVMKEAIIEFIMKESGEQ